MIWAVIIVVLTMALNDILAVILVVAESRGRSLLAGVCDALGDIARVIYIAVGVDSVIKGIDTRTVCVFVAMVVTSFVTTTAVTSWARRIKEVVPA